VLNTINKITFFASSDHNSSDASYCCKGLQGFIGKTGNPGTSGADGQPGPTVRMFKSNYVLRGKSVNPSVVFSDVFIFILGNCGPSRTQGR